MRAIAWDGHQSPRAIINEPLTAWGPCQRPTATLREHSWAGSGKRWPAVSIDHQRRLIDSRHLIAIFCDVRDPIAYRRKYWRCERVCTRQGLRDWCLSIDHILRRPERT